MQCRLISTPEPVAYALALAQQYELARQRAQGLVPDTLLLLEHPPTITLGRRTSEDDLRTPEAVLRARGFAVERVDRGGEITYHGPGQLVGYPILDLRGHGQDLHRYLRDLEEVLIQTLTAFGLTGERVPGRTGVWVQDRKIAAIGIKVSRWISLHGFALNITTSLAPFREDFVPCGIADKDVTSMAEMLGADCPARAGVEAVLTDVFARIMGLTFFVSHRIIWVQMNNEVRVPKYYPKGEVLRKVAERYPTIDADAIEIIIRIKQLASSDEGAFQEALEPYGLSEGRFFVVCCLFSEEIVGHKDPSPSEIAEHLGVTRATVTGLLDGLERDGFLERHHDRKDRRALTIHLTDKGRGVLDKFIPEQFPRIKHQVFQLSPEEKQTLIALLAKLQA